MVDTLVYGAVNKIENKNKIITKEDFPNRTVNIVCGSADDGGIGAGLATDGGRTISKASSNNTPGYGCFYSTDKYSTYSTSNDSIFKMCVKVDGVQQRNGYCIFGIAAIGSAKGIDYFEAGSVSSLSVSMPSGAAPGYFASTGNNSISGLTESVTTNGSYSVFTFRTGIWGGSILKDNVGKFAVGSPYGMDTPKAFYMAGSDGGTNNPGGGVYCDWFSVERNLS